MDRESSATLYAAVGVAGGVLVASWGLAALNYVLPDDVFSTRIGLLLGLTEFVAWAGTVTYGGLRGWGHGWEAGKLGG
jgi:hypothetical protein